MEIAEVIVALEVEVPPQVTNALGVVAQVTGKYSIQILSTRLDSRFGVAHFRVLKKQHLLDD